MKVIRNQLKIGDVVVVKAGVIDPDFGREIGGWAGIISNIEADDRLGLLYKVKWDRYTLNMMDNPLKMACAEQCLDFESMYLAGSEIECHSGGFDLDYFYAYARVKKPDDIINEYLSRHLL